MVRAVSTRMRNMIVLGLAIVIHREKSKALEPLIKTSMYATKYIYINHLVDSIRRTKLKENNLEPFRHDGIWIYCMLWPHCWRKESQPYRPPFSWMNCERFLILRTNRPFGLFKHKLDNAWKQWLVRVQNALPWTTNRYIEKTKTKDKTGTYRIGQATLKKDNATRGTCEDVQHGDSFSTWEH